MQITKAVITNAKYNDRFNDMFIIHTDNK